MLKLIIFIILINFIIPTDCKYQTIMKSERTLCINDSYIIPLFSKRLLRMTFNRSRLTQRNIHTIRIHTTIENEKVAELKNHVRVIENIFHFTNKTKDINVESTIVYDIYLYANYMNRTYIDYTIQTINTNNEINYLNCSIVLLISQPQRLLDKIFKSSIPYIITVISVQMGILLEIEVLRELLRRPIQILIGFTCQYCLMPLIAFSISKIFRYETLYGLGLFVVGCCPGGSASNQWTVIFDGDLNLSAFMSFASTVASFFMMPIWLYTLGQYAYLRQLKIQIPFFALAKSLFTIIGPLGLGMFLVYFIPKLKSLVKRIVKPTLLLLICYFFVFGSFVNYYLFSYVDLVTALSAPLLPWSGFLLGGFFAWICRQDTKRIITIGIETGIQNVGIAFMILLYSFPAPYNTQASVIPLIVAYLSTQPFHIILICRIIKRKFFSSKRQDKTTDRVDENETDQLANLSVRRRISLPMSVVGLSADPEPLEI